ncbi:MAG: ABC transporter ATP-binding protein [Bacteroidales bacterium]|nr:ABC transporter ATP-binding protein [Bacteroidales bacterium]
MRNPMAQRPHIGGTPEKARSNRKTLLRLLPYWKEHWLLMTGLLLCSVASVGVTLAAPYLIGRTIDDCISVTDGISIDYPLMSMYLFALAVIYVLGSLASWAQEFGMTWVSQQIVAKLRRQMMDHLVNLDVNYYDTNSRGDILSRFSNDAELVKDGMGQALIQVVTTVVSMIGMITTMIVLSPSLTGLVCLSIPLVLLLTRIIVRRSRRFFDRQQVALGKMNSVVEESINGLRVIRSLGREEDWRLSFEKANTEMRLSGTKAQINSGLLMPMLRVLDNFTYILVAVVGGMMALQGALTVGTIQSFLLYTRNFLRPVNMIATQMNSLQSAFAGAERVFDMLDVVPKIMDKKDAVNPSADVKGHVVFDHVQFGYTPEKQILKDVSFTALPGQVVAIVGGTGAGKTTLMNLLSRFYDVDGGRILLDGVDVRDYGITYLRDSMAVVLQEPILFTDTVQNNICYGDPARHSLEEAQESARLAMAESFIERLPHGYETVLLRQGENISHGQKQLLTIARAIHSRAPILVLDEATSNIDTHTELLLQKAIDNLTAGKTCFMIAHRLSTIRGADLILVMEHGQIVEQGTHDELLAKGGVYKGIYDAQFDVA